MSAQWRRKLVSIARKYELLIIENAAYAFLAKDPPVPLAALAPETTVYASGLSKSIATGLRALVSLPHPLNGCPQSSKRSGLPPGIRLA